MEKCAYDRLTRRSAGFNATEACKWCAMLFLHWSSQVEWRSHNVTKPQKPAEMKETKSREKNVKRKRNFLCRHSRSKIAEKDVYRSGQTIMERKERGEES